MHSLKISGIELLFNSLGEVKRILTDLIQQDFISFLTMDIVLDDIKVQEHLTAVKGKGCCGQRETRIGFTEDKLKGYSKHDLFHEFKMDMSKYRLVFDFEVEEVHVHKNKPVEEISDISINWEDL